jgi:hypothetical protein
MGILRTLLIGFLASADGHTPLRTKALLASDDLT